MTNQGIASTIIEGILIEGLTQLTFNCKKYRNTIVVLVFGVSNEIPIYQKLFGHGSTIPADIAPKVTFLVINVHNPGNASIVECFKITRYPAFVINKTVYNPDTNTPEFRRITTVETLDLPELIQAIRDQCSDTDVAIC